MVNTSLAGLAVHGRTPKAQLSPFAVRGPSTLLSAVRNAHSTGGDAPNPVNSSTMHGLLSRALRSLPAGPTLRHIDEQPNSRSAEQARAAAAVDGAAVGCKHDDFVLRYGRSSVTPNSEHASTHESAPKLIRAARRVAV
jgi:hypothetical protein